MNAKNCPKCGESNPNEAVMCWSCYTPLTGSATGDGPSVGGIGDRPPMGGEAPAKKAAEPWQMGVIGLFLVIVLFMGMRTLTGGPKQDDVGPTPDTNTEVIPPNPDGTNSQPLVVNVSWPSGLGAPLPAVTSQFTMVAPPYPGVSWATMAIVPTNPNLSTVQAAALAGFARQQVVGADRWQGFTIYVFADQPSAQMFKDTQDRKRGQPLMYADYQALSTIWPKTLAVYDYSKNRAGVRFPRTNPNGWWTYRPKLSPVK
jgi:hypothetical protein